MTKKESEKLFGKTYFYNETFGMYYHFTGDLEEYKLMMEWMGHKTPENIGGRCVQAHNNGEIRIIIGLFDDDIATLVHECTHASLYTLDAIGQKLNYDDELLPYLTGWIFRECQKKTKCHKA